MKKQLAIVGMAAILSLLLPTAAQAETPELRARAALLLDGVSGQVLYSTNGQALNYPASTTELLTALVAVERGKLDQIITVSDSAVDQPPGSSSCYLERGEQQTLENLLYGLLLASGNDCADAIAEGVSEGNPAQFMVWMNETAQDLGAGRSHFTNAHGLHDPEHYTTALDLALIARGALANPTVRKIAGTREFHWPGKSERNGLYYNHNQMLSYYDGTMGGKTGFTEQAGLTLVSAAQRGERYLIGIVMGEKWKMEQYQDMIALLDYGFERFSQKELVTAGAPFGDLPVTGGKADTVPVIAQARFLASAPEGQQPGISMKTVLKDRAEAPIEAGEQLGHVEIREGERVLGTVPLVARESVEAHPLFGQKLVAAGLTGLKWLACLLGGLLVFRTVVRAIRRSLRRSRGHRSPGRPRGARTGTIAVYRTRGR